MERFRITSWHAKHFAVVCRMAVRLIIGITYGHRVDSFDDEVGSRL